MYIIIIVRFFKFVFNYTPIQDEEPSLEEKRLKAVTQLHTCINTEMKDIEDKALKHAYQVLYGFEQGSKMFPINTRGRTQLESSHVKKRVTFSNHIEYSRN